jgi:hypothetical protein
MFPTRYGLDSYMLFRRNSVFKSSQSHIATNGQSISKSWWWAPSAAHDQNIITVWQLRSCFCGAPMRTGLSFVYAACPCQRSLSWVRVPWDSRPHFTLSDLRLPFSSPPMTRRVMAEFEIKDMLRLTVIRPVCFGVRPPSGAQDQNFVTVRQLRICWCGAPSLTRGRSRSDIRMGTPHNLLHTFLAAFFRTFMPTDSI